jgi:Type II CAAX prenyl endopeptidase Rce1-like
MPSRPRVRETPAVLRPILGYFERRVDPLTNLFLVLPLFAIYHLGVLTQMRRSGRGFTWVGNGMDFLTGTVLALVNGDVMAYAGIAAGVTILLGLLILRARRQSSLHPRLFIPVLLESTIYALIVASLIGSIVRTFGLGVLDQEGLPAQIIASCGAGLHEEIVFRMGLFAGLGYLLSRRMRPWVGWAIALLASSVLFSAVHYLPPLGDPFSVSSFVFRLLCGVAFALIYRLRGFAIAAWTHALYDIFYFVLRHT